MGSVNEENESKVRRRKADGVFVHHGKGFRF